MKVTNPINWTRRPALFCLVLTLFGGLTPQVAIAQEEKPVEDYPGVLQREIRLWSDGTRLSGVLLYPKEHEAEKKLPALVLCNGWGGTKAFLMRSGIAPRFAAAGYVVINYDYRGWGDSDRRLVFRGKMPEPDQDSHVHVEVQAIRELVDPVDQQADIDAAISYVWGEPMVDQERIGIWGTSFGGGHVIYRAAHDSRIACVVAQVGSMPADWTKQYPAGLKKVYEGKSARARGLVDPVPQGGGSPGVLQGTPYHERIALFNPGQYADRVKVPTLLIDAELEHYFKIEENSGRVHEILKRNGVSTEYHVLKGKKHYDVYSGPLLDEVMKLEISWFDKHLKNANGLAGMEPSAAPQENWPRFRGPNADGVARVDSRLPEVWGTSTNVKWMTEVPGLGWSSPVVWGNKVFLTTVVSEEENIRPQKGLYLGDGVRDPAKGIHHWRIYGFDLDTGVELWKQEAHTGNPRVPRHPKNTYASETATTEGERLYVLFGDLGLYCYDLNGNPVWSHPIDPKKTFMNYGAAASPVVHDGQVFVVYDNLEASWIAAFDAQTGQVRWKRPREETHSWATPFVWKNELRTEIVVPGKKRNRSYSLTGEVLWEFDGRMSNLVIPSPFAAHGLCYIASGYVGDAHRPTFAIRPGATGDITPKDEQDFAVSPYIEWYQPKASSYNTSQIVYGDYFYTLYDQGFLTCHNAWTGELVHGKERFQPRASFTASPWAYNGYLFCLSEEGQTFVMKAGPEFEIVTINELDELCLATPAIADGKLLIRTASRLYCITGGARAKDLPGPEQAGAPTAREIDLWTAAREGNRDALIRNLESGTSVDAKDPQEGSTPLIVAVLFGRTEIVKLLLEKGADVSVANRDGNTALHVAAFLADLERINLLLKHGASVSAKNGRGETPLDVVAADWNPQLEALYGYVSGLIGMDLDLAQIRRARPEVAKILRDHAAVPGVAPDALQKASTELHAAIGSGQVAGAAHLVVQNGKVVRWEVEGESDIEDKTPFEKDALVRIYSMTKPITSVAAMVLHEQGKFQLDDPVAKFIPAFTRTTVLVKDGDTNKIVPANRPITIRDVFRHTTGYSYGDESTMRAYYEHEGMRYHGTAEMFPPEMTIEKAAEVLPRVPALHHPGERFTYGFNTDLLGRLIEIWSGQSLDAFLKQTVFEPLQMVDTGFSVPPDKRHRLSTCHTWRDGKLAIADKAKDSPFNEGFDFLSGGGGLLSTMQDYANFCQMLVDGGQFKGKRLLQEVTVKLMFTDQLNGVAGDFRFGLGFAIGEITLGTGDRQRPAVQYSWGGYASTDFRLVPEEKLFQIVMQQRVPTSSDLANRLFPIVYAGWRSFVKEQAGSRVPLDGEGDESMDTWKPLPDMALPRWEAGTVVLDDKLYVFGGYEMPTKSCKRVDVFNPKDNSWRQLADLPSAITHMNAVLDGRTVWIAGGSPNGATPQPAMWVRSTP